MSASRETGRTRGNGRKRWTWDDHPIYGRGRNVIKDEGRSLSYGDVTVITSVGGGY